MRLRAVLGVALRRLRKRPVRTLLLLQGTVWGVAVAIGPSAVIEGTRDAARFRGAAIGADRISVTPDPTSARGSVFVRRDLATVRDALAADGRAPSHAGAARLVRTIGQASGDGTLTLIASTPGTERARGLALASGRWLRAEDAPDRCVVESGVAEWLGRTTVVPGDAIQLPGAAAPLTVVGVAAPRSAEVLRTNDLGFDLEHGMFKNFGQQLLLSLGIALVNDDWKREERCVYTPLTGGDTTVVDWLLLRVDPTDVNPSADRVRDTLIAEGKAAVTLYPIVLPLILGEQVERFDAVNLAMFLACLLMGAVVMMNFGLLNVISRAREIAIRRTEGATERDIELQFLVEGLVLALIGGVLGCFLGMGLAELRASLEPVTGFTWSFPWRQAVFAVSVAVLVGLLAAYLPARKAARQDPVRGLADE